MFAVHDSTRTRGPFVSPFDVKHRPRHETPLRNEVLASNSSTAHSPIPCSPSLFLDNPPEDSSHSSVAAHVVLPCVPNNSSPRDDLTISTADKAESPARMSLRKRKRPDYAQMIQGNTILDADGLPAIHINTQGHEEVVDKLNDTSDHFKDAGSPEVLVLDEDNVHIHKKQRRKSCSRSAESLHSTHEPQLCVTDRLETTKGKGTLLANHIENQEVQRRSGRAPKPSMKKLTAMENLMLDTIVAGVVPASSGCLIPGDVSTSDNSPAANNDTKPTVVQRTDQDLSRDSSVQTQPLKLVLKSTQTCNELVEEHLSADYFSASSQPPSRSQTPTSRPSNDSTSSQEYTNNFIFHRLPRVSARQVPVTKNSPKAGSQSPSVLLNTPDSHSTNTLLKQTKTSIPAIAVTQAPLFSSNLMPKSMKVKANPKPPFGSPPSTRTPSPELSMTSLMPPSSHASHHQSLPHSRRSTPKRSMGDVASRASDVEEDMIEIEVQRPGSPSLLATASRSARLKLPSWKERKKRNELDLQQDLLLMRVRLT